MSQYYFYHFSRGIPEAVRLAFHDCFGGCNGCINPELPDNNGQYLHGVQRSDTIQQARDQVVNWFIRKIKVVQHRIFYIM